MPMREVFPKLYHRGSKGEIRQWQMELQVEEDGSAAYRVISGSQGAKLTESGWKTIKGKGIGKAATSPEVQARKEIASTYTKKKETKYHETLDTIDTVEIKFDVMLAQTFKDWPSFQKRLKKEFGEETRRMFAQPKLDGMRCVARPGDLMSRGWKPINGAPHITEALADFHARFPEHWLDGELYNHDYAEDFNTIISRIKKDPLKGNRSPEEIAEILELSRGVIQYHIYDIPTHPGTFAERIEFIEQELFQHLGEDTPIHLVETVEITNFSFEQVSYLIVGWQKERFEGGMLRVDVEYENDRSWGLWKWKDWIDEEFELLRGEPGVGNWANALKSVTFRLPNGGEGSAGVIGEYDLNVQRLKDLDKYLGNPVTIRYQNLTPAGKPRFATAIKFWDAEALATGDRD